MILQYMNPFQKHPILTLSLLAGVLLLVIMIFVRVMTNHPNPSSPYIKISELENWNYRRTRAHLSYHNKFLYLCYPSIKEEPATIFEINIETHEFKKRSFDSNIHEVIPIPSRNILISESKTGQFAVQEYGNLSTVHRFPIGSKYGSSIAYDEESKLAIYSGKSKNILYSIDLDTMKMLSKTSIPRSGLSSSYHFTKTASGDLFLVPQSRLKGSPTYIIFSPDDKAHTRPRLAIVKGDGNRLKQLGYANEIGWLFRDAMSKAQKLLTSVDSIDLPREYWSSRPCETAYGYFIYDDKEGVTVVDLYTQDHWQFIIPKTESKDRVSIYLVPELKGVVLGSGVTLYMMQLDTDIPELVPFHAPS